jgi:hypothetical protein
VISCDHRYIRVESLDGVMAKVTCDGCGSPIPSFFDVVNGHVFMVSKPEEVSAMPKYQNGNPGSPIDMLGEEGSEVSQEVHKASRFGLNSERSAAFGYTGIPTRENLLTEVGDFLVALDLCVELGYFTGEEIVAAKAKKLEKLAASFGADFRDRMPRP